MTYKNPKSNKSNKIKKWMRMTYKNPKSNPTKNMSHHSGSLGLVRKNQGNAGEKKVVVRLTDLS